MPKSMYKKHSRKKKQSAKLRNKEGPFGPFF